MLAGRWIAGRGELISLAQAFISHCLMRPKEFKPFLQRRENLQSSVDGFSLRDVVPDATTGNSEAGSPLPSEFRDPSLKPKVLMYGSAIAGTAFLHGDMDYAVVFTKPRAQKTDEDKATQQIEFVVPDRIYQPAVLSSLHDHIRRRDSSLRFQRIFRARIPIMQFVPELGTLQEQNEKHTALGVRTAPSVEAASLNLTRLPSTFAPSLLSTITGTPGSHTALSSEAVNAVLLNRKREHFDVSLSLDGCRNSLLLREYMKRWPSARVLTLILKHWGRRARILNARAGWLSPYALTVMAIHYLIETKVVSHISQAQIDDLLRSDLAVLTDRAEVLPWSTSLLDSDQDSLLSSDPAFSDLPELLRGFFAFYAEHFDFDVDVVDIRSESDIGGRILTKQQWLADPEISKMDDRERWHRLGYQMVMIRDPFEDHSLGRSLEFFRAEALREKFRAALVDGIHAEDLLAIPHLPVASVDDAEAVAAPQ